MPSGVFTPYSTGADLFGSKPAWIPDELDQQRIQSYLLYEQMYWNVPDVFKVALRGSNDQPIYIPSSRTIVDTTNRYVATGFNVSAVDAVTMQATSESFAATTVLRDLFRRERFRSKYNGAKRYGIIRGDWIWHLTADTTKSSGTRLSITALDPAMYFPLTDPDNVDRVIGCHLVENIETEDGPRIRRKTYRKTETGTVTVEDGLFKVDAWAGDGPPERIIQIVTELPSIITSLPVYHIRNFEEPGNPFGSSELRGLERIMSAINQTVSDEDLALALEGIGMYATNASQPIDPGTKQPTNWKLGPGRVVHHDGDSFERVSGVSNLGDTYGNHFDRLVTALRESAATPEVAIGRADVQVAQSGIALALQLGPMLAKASEKTELIVDTHTQMWYDILNMWLPAYEATSFDGLTSLCTVADAVPVDREKRFAELRQMWEDGVIDTTYYRDECAKLGYSFPEGMADRAKAEYDARNVDQFAARLTQDTTDAGTVAP